MPKRSYDIDWLRILATGMVFLFHCARFFNTDDWHVKNNATAFGADVFVGVVVQWIMPLFFVLSGISTYYALTVRSNGSFLGERVKRLAVPLLFGIFVLIPPQVYIERVTHGDFFGSLLRFIPFYFDGLYGIDKKGNFAWMGLHLWYLEMLLMFSLILLPVFRFLGRGSGQAAVRRLTDVLAAPGRIFLLAIPMVLMETLTNLQPDGIGIRGFGGWSPAVYLLFFLTGYLVAADHRWRASIQQQRIVALALAIASTVVGFVLLESGYSDRAVAMSVLRGFNSWFWLVAILGFGREYLSFDHPFLRYGNEAVLPFYILHQTVIVVIGYFIAAWDIPVLVKYPILATIAFLIIMAAYDGLIRRSNVLRLLFGMKARAKAGAVVSSTVSG